MPAREPKTTQFTTIQIVGRDSGRKGRLELSSGNVSYFPKNAPKPALSLTYQQLTDLLEREIEYQDIDRNAPLPKGGKSDFWFEAYDHAGATAVGSAFDDVTTTAHGACALSRM